MTTEQEQGKFVTDSYAETVHAIMPPDLNGHGTLFGGRLAEWIDLLAGIVACRHCGKTVTTAAIDNLRFRKPVGPNHMVIMKGKLTHVGVTSMEVRVDSYSEDYAGNRKQINTAFVIEVALDDRGKPCPIPAIIPRSDEEKREFENGAKRRDMRKTILQDMYE